MLNSFLAGVISNWTDENRVPPCTIFQAFKYYLDITTPPTPLLLQQFALLATSDKEKKRLQVLSKVKTPSSSRPWGQSQPQDTFTPHCGCVESLPVTAELLPSCHPPQLCYRSGGMLVEGHGLEEVDAAALSPLLPWLQGLQEYEEWKWSKNPTIVEVLEEFPSVQMPSTLLLTQLPLLQPRYYSISSSPEMYPGEVHLTVAVVSYRTRGTALMQGAVETGSGWGAGEKCLHMGNATRSLAERWCFKAFLPAAKTRFLQPVPLLAHVMENGHPSVYYRGARSGSGTSHSGSKLHMRSFFCTH